MDYILIKLFKDIIDGRLDLLDIKPLFSSMNHYKKFINSVEKSLDVRYLGEYLVILREDNLLAVVGINDKKNLFCQILPTKFDRTLFSMLSNKTIRKFMGFDKHFHELEYLEEGVKLRFQGDLLVEFLKLYDTTRHLIRFIRHYLMHTILTLPIAFVNEPLEKRLIANLSKFRLLFESENALIDYMLNELSSIIRKQDNRTKFNEILFVSTLLPAIFTVNEDIDDIILPSDIEEYLVSFKKSFHNFVRTIIHLEKHLSILIERHQVRLAGIRVADINVRTSIFNHNVFRSISLPGNEFKTFIVLREQEISAYHPEHTTVQLFVRPCIIRLSSLHSLDKLRSYSIALDNSVLQNSVFFTMDLLSQISKLEQTITMDYPTNVLMNGAIQIGFYDKILKEKTKKITISIGKNEIDLTITKVLGNRGTPTIYFIVHQKEKIL